MPKVRYFLDSLWSSITRHGYDCPSCGASDYEQVDRKYVVTLLARCHRCHLLYRAPTTTSARFRRYYQDEYSEGFTTDLPDAATLSNLKRVGFVGSDKDYSTYLAVLRALGARPGHTVADFGCSWGYGSWQLARAGFAVQAYELSDNRRSFAKEQMGVDARSTPDSLSGPFDFFFSSHVLEHVPKVSAVIALARRVVRPGGWFVAFTPNGSTKYRKVNPEGWRRSWGFAHPLALDDEFYRTAFATDPYLLDASPYRLDEISTWSKQPRGAAILATGGAELLIAARLNG